MMSFHRLPCPSDCSSPSQRPPHTPNRRRTSASLQPYVESHYVAECLRCTPAGGCVRALLAIANGDRCDDEPHGRGKREGCRSRSDPPALQSMRRQTAGHSPVSFRASLRIANGCKRVTPGNRKDHSEVDGRRMSCT